MSDEDTNPSPEDTRKAFSIVADVMWSMIPAPARPYMLAFLVAFGVSTGVNAADQFYGWAGIATTESQKRQEAKIDALIEAFKVAHPDVDVVLTVHDE